MSASRLSKICNKDSEYKEIKPNELLSTEILPEDMVSLNNFIKTEVKRLKLFSLTSLFFLMLSFFLFYDGIISTNMFFTKECALILFLIIGISLMIIYNLKLIYSLLNNKEPKAQYGTIQYKYIRKNSSDSTTTEHYYINVNFPLNDTFIKKIECKKDIYEALEIESPVLIVSFNDKKAYAIIPK